MLRSRRPDVLLLDLVMPGMDGFQVLEAKAKEPSIAGIPVIIMSAVDPKHDSTSGRTVTIGRPGGISDGDLVRVVEAIVSALKPQFGDEAPPETTGAS